MELITSIKSLILKRVQSGHLNPPSSPDQSLEAAFEQMINNKYSKHFFIESIKKFRLSLDHPVAGNTDGFVQGIINDMENLYASKQQRSNSLNT